MLLLIFLSISLLLILFFINMIINSIIIDMIINPFFPGEVWRGGAPPVRGGGSGGGSSPLGKQSKPHKKKLTYSAVSPEAVEFVNNYEGIDVLV